MNAVVEKMEAPAPAAHSDPMLAVIENVMLNPDADLDKLERFIAMQERREERQAKQAFDEAIAEAKAQIPEITRTGTVDYTTDKGRVAFKHETMAGVAKIVDPILSAHGLSYRYRSEQSDGRVFVTCIVAHRGGYSEETTLSGAPDTSGSKNNFQAVGSTVTYLQRYTLKLALGLTAADDKDGNVPPEQTIDESQAAQIRARLKAIGLEEKVILDAEGLREMDDMPAGKFKLVMDKLATTAKQRGVEL